VGLALVRSFGMASATPLCLRRWIIPLMLDHTDIGSVLHNKSASRGHFCDSRDFLFISDFICGYQPAIPQLFSRR